MAFNISDKVSGRSNAPRLSNDGESSKDKRLSVCTICKSGIFIGQPRIWTKVGLIHDSDLCKGRLDEA